MRRSPIRSWTVDAEECQRACAAITPSSSSTSRPPPGASASALAPCSHFTWSSGNGLCELHDVKQLSRATRKASMGAVSGPRVCPAETKHPAPHVLPWLLIANAYCEGGCGGYRDIRGRVGHEACRSSCDHAWPDCNAVTYDRRSGICHLLDCHGNEPSSCDSNRNGWTYWRRKQGQGLLPPPGHAGGGANHRGLEGTLRLMGRHATMDRGRLELFYDGQWGTISSDYFALQNARVACRQLGFRDGVVVDAAAFGPATGQIWLNDLTCRGDEAELLKCKHGLFGSKDDEDHSTDVAVACTANRTAVWMEGSGALRCAQKGCAALVAQADLKRYHCHSEECEWETCCWRDLDEARTQCGRWPGCAGFWGMTNGQFFARGLAAMLEPGVAGARHWVKLQHTPEVHLPSHHDSTPSTTSSPPPSALRPEVPACAALNDENNKFGQCGATLNIRCNLEQGEDFRYCDEHRGRCGEALPAGRHQSKGPYDYDCEVPRPLKGWCDFLLFSFWLSITTLCGVAYWRRCGRLPRLSEDNGDDQPALPHYKSSGGLDLSPLTPLNRNDTNSDPDDEQEEPLVWVDVPSYWKNRDPMQPFATREKVPRPFVGQVQELLHKTFQRIKTRDRLGQMPCRLEVTRVQRIENRRMWGKYLAAKEGIRKERGSTRSLCEMYGDPRFHVKTQHACVHEPLEERINEFYLFHGTTPQSATEISKHGFSLRRAGLNAGAMFGKGAYFAECCSKSDEYATEDEGIHEGTFAMLLCRVVCGEMFRVTKSDTKRITNARATGHWDSVLGDREVAAGTYREFVVFREEQVYPEYVILYHRIFDEEDEDAAP